MDNEPLTNDRDAVFETETPRGSDFRFDADVAAVFDDMLVRSIPFYLEQQRMLLDVAEKFYIPGTVIYDLGCSTATTMISLAHKLGRGVRLVGYDNSEPMLAKARKKIALAELSDQIEVRHGELSSGAGSLDLENASVVTMCWTLQFIRPLCRTPLIRRIYDGLRAGGALVITEKVLTNDSDMNRFFIDFYYDFKRRNGYSEQEILRKREALENVLIPYRVDENLELFRHGGFDIAESFFQWYNFAGFLCVKKEE